MWMEVVCNDLMRDFVSCTGALFQIISGIETPNEGLPRFVAKSPCSVGKKENGKKLHSNPSRERGPCSY